MEYVVDLPIRSMRQRGDYGLLLLCDDGHVFSMSINQTQLAKFKMLFNDSKLAKQAEPKLSIEEGHHGLVSACQSSVTMSQCLSSVVDTEMINRLGGDYLVGMTDYHGQVDIRTRSTNAAAEAAARLVDAATPIINY